MDPTMAYDAARRVPSQVCSASFWCSAILVGTLLIGAAPAEAQLRIGGHFVNAQDAFDGTYGIGVRLGLDPPVLPLELIGSGEYFFADCPAGQSGCGLYGLTVDANFRIVFPVVRPYVSAGLAYRNIDLADPTEDDSVVGPTLGVGLDVGLSGFSIFGESRYEFVDAPEKQFVWRLGAMFEPF
jgi:hypothetical protein